MAKAVGCLPMHAVRCQMSLLCGKYGQKTLKRVTLQCVRVCWYNISDSVFEDDVYAKD